MAAAQVMLLLGPCRRLIRSRSINGISYFVSELWRHVCRRVHRPPRYLQGFAIARSSASVRFGFASTWAFSLPTLIALSNGLVSPLCISIRMGSDARPVPCEAPHSELGFVIGSIGYQSIWISGPPLQYSGPPWLPTSKRLGGRSDRRNHTRFDRDIHRMARFRGKQPLWSSISRPSLFGW